jgi:hypothetical protein
MGHVYALGAVKPWVKTAAQEVGDKFDVSTIYGVGARTGDSDHPGGYALDFMVYADRAKGDEIYAYGKANWDRLGIKYIIWFQRIDEGGGLKPMENRGGTTANHKDHNHWSFTSNGGSSGSNLPGASGSTTADVTGGTGITDALATLTSSGTWIRVLEFVAGVALILIALWPVINRVSGGLI